MLRVDWNLLLTIINLLLLFVLMRIFLFKPVQKIIAARQEEADRQFKEADERKQAAEEARKQYEDFKRLVENTDFWNTFVHIKGSETSGKKE